MQWHSIRSTSTIVAVCAVGWLFATAGTAFAQEGSSGGIPNERETPPRKPPGDEELTEAVLSAIRAGTIGRRDWDLVSAYLHDSPEKRTELKASVQASAKQLKQQAKRLGEVEDLHCRTRENIARQILTTDDVGNAHFTALLDAVSDHTQAELAGTIRHEERLGIRTRHLERSKKLERQASEGLKSGEYSQVDHLRATTARLAAEITLHGERYPDTLPRQLEAHLTRVEAMQITYLKVTALWEIGYPGGEEEKVAISAVALARSRAKLELARGDFAKALCYQRAAYVAGERGVQATLAAYETGTITLDMLVGAIVGVTDTWLALLDLERRYGDPTLAD